MEPNNYGDDTNAELRKVSDNIPGHPGVDLTRQGKVNYHGPPSDTELTQNDSRHLMNQSKRKDETISHLMSELQLCKGKIKGYQTLGHLYQESKQECAQYKQKNEELANKLDLLMRRLLPEQELVPVSSGDRVVSGIFNASGDTVYGTPLERFEEIDEKVGVSSNELQASSKIAENAVAAGTHSSLADMKGSGSSDVDPIATEEAITCMNAEQGTSNKRLSESSTSSSSFMCITGSGLSSMEHARPPGSVEEETTVSIGNRPTVVDESITDLRTLEEFIHDPNSSSELRVMAADLLKIGNRAAKIEKQARIQQVLLNELQNEKVSLIQEVKVKQQELEDIQEKYSVVLEKLPRKGPARTDSDARLSDLSSNEWVEVGNQTAGGSSSILLESTKMEVQLRAKIQNLQKQVSDLDLANQNLSERWKQSESKNHQLFLELNTLSQQLQESKKNDLRRQQEFDTMLLASKKQREELENEKENALCLVTQEKRQRTIVEDQCSVLQDKISELESRIRQSERQQSLNLMETVRSPAFDSSIKCTEPPSVIQFPKNPSILTDLTILQQQVTIYKEDFDHERRDRELAQSHLDAVKLQLSEARTDLDSAHLQINSLTSDLRSAKSENLHLKRKFMQALDELKVLKGQIRPVRARPHHSHFQHGFDNDWICRLCTFENPGVRQTCEICGADASRSAGAHALPESVMDLTGRGGRPFDNQAVEFGYCSPLEEDKSPSSSNKAAPKF